MATAVMNARVDHTIQEKAGRVLKANGVTASEVIRNLMSFIAETGTLPSCVRSDDEARRRQKLAAFEALTAELENAPLADDPYTQSLTDEQIIEQERMRRFG